jgi:hypothetical protein
LVILDTSQRRQRRQIRACTGLASKRATRLLDPIGATYDIRSRQELVGTGYRA